jgi:hypothetical protein
MMTLRRVPPRSTTKAVSFSPEKLSALEAIYLGSNNKPNKWRHTSLALPVAGAGAPVELLPPAVVDLAGLHVDGCLEGHIPSRLGDTAFVPQASQRRGRSSEEGKSDVTDFGEHGERPESWLAKMSDGQKVMAYQS